MWLIFIALAIIWLVGLKNFLIGAAVIFFMIHFCEAKEEMRANGEL